MNFSKALNKIKDGHKLKRANWSEDKHITMEHTNVITEYGKRGKYVWMVSHEDILSDDWYIENN